MPTAMKPKATSLPFSRTRIAAAKAAAPPAAPDAAPIDWSRGIVTPGGGVAATVSALRRRTRGPSKRPAKEQVAIRLDPEVLEAFRADGPGWQTRMNVALKDWLAAQAAKRKTERESARKRTPKSAETVAHRPVNKAAG